MGSLMGAARARKVCVAGETSNAVDGEQAAEAMWPWWSRCPEKIGNTDALMRLCEFGDPQADPDCSAQYKGAAPRRRADLSSRVMALQTLVF